MEELKKIEKELTERENINKELNEILVEQKAAIDERDADINRLEKRNEKLQGELDQLETYRDHEALQQRYASLLGFDAHIKLKNDDKNPYICFKFPEHDHNIEVIVSNGGGSGGEVIIGTINISKLLNAFLNCVKVSRKHIKNLSEGDELYEKLRKIGLSPKEGGIK